MIHLQIKRRRERWSCDFLRSLPITVMKKSWSISLLPSLSSTSNLNSTTPVISPDWWTYCMYPLLMSDCRKVLIGPLEEISSEWPPLTYCRWPAGESWVMVYSNMESSESMSVDWRSLDLMNVDDPMIKSINNGIIIQGTFKVYLNNETCKTYVL